MYLKSQALIILMIFMLIVRNCSMINNPNNLFGVIITPKRAFQTLIKKWKNSISNKKNFLSESDSQQHQLNLIYLYYNRGKLVNAQKMIQKYISFYPNQSNIDYVLYMRGLIYIRLDQYVWRKVFRLNLSHCNSEYAESALSDFYQLILSYPESKYVINAQKHISALKERLANYELIIASYYFRHEDYQSVIYRIENMILHYPQTKYTKKALSLLKRAYQKIRIHDVKY
ncbi:MAG: outer membrane protein assembly factor BamD [Candidatus Dasytiphilus stammeri]